MSHKYSDSGLLIVAASDSGVGMSAAALLESAVYGGYQGCEEEPAPSVCKLVSVIRATYACLFYISNMLTKLYFALLPTLTAVST